MKNEKGKSFLHFPLQIQGIVEWLGTSYKFLSLSKAWTLFSRRPSYLHSVFMVKASQVSTNARDFSQWGLSVYVQSYMSYLKKLTNLTNVQIVFEVNQRAFIKYSGLKKNKSVSFHTKVLILK